MSWSTRMCNMQWSIISQRVLKVITRGRSSLSKMKIIILFKTSKNCTGLVSASFTQAYVRITLSLLSWPNVPSHHSFISTTIKINQLLTFILTTSTPCVAKTMFTNFTNKNFNSEPYEERHEEFNK